MIFIIMGVCGSGKTTVGEALATKVGCVFRDADPFHSDENRKKMSRGIPLSDEDRWPWLQRIHEFIISLLKEGKTGVVTCSALKKSYRDVLLNGISGNSKTDWNSVLFVYLKGTYSILHDRLISKQRTSHFMPASLLDSQLETLEVPTETENHIMIDTGRSFDDIVSEITRFVSTKSER